MFDTIRFSPAQQMREQIELANGQRVAFDHSNESVSRAVEKRVGRECLVAALVDHALARVHQLNLVEHERLFEQHERVVGAQIAIEKFDTPAFERVDRVLFGTIEQAHDRIGSDRVDVVRVDVAEHGLECDSVHVRNSNCRCCGRRRRWCTASSLGHLSSSSEEHCFKDSTAYAEY